MRCPSCNEYQPEGIDSDECLSCGKPILTPDTQYYQRKSLDAQISLRADVGPEIIEHVFKQMKIDEKWSIKFNRGFSWWAKNLKQTIWAELVFEDEGMLISRLYSRCEILTGFEASTENYKILDPILSMASLSGILIEESNPDSLSYVCSMYAHEQNRMWVKNFFSLAVALQVGESQNQAESLARLTQSNLASSKHPASGNREISDDMLNFIDVVKLADKTLPDDEFKSIAAFLNESPGIQAVGGDSDLRVQFSFNERTMYFQVDVVENNPLMGKGALFLLQFPGQDDLASGIRLALKLNSLEFKSMTRANFLGSWCLSNERILTHVSFVPAIGYQKGLLMNLCMSMAFRAKWFSELLR